ncbi:hypothetical protein LF1_40580 [Rubripirellula obstinata]|uniref:Transposase IS200-like domain-containing protein n=1 Tax=Rubripirellula obstinata TaxID=406547 RepID=A0A5B1CKD0_9BACT|nr:transposase [Rubripirellula obstinata]KAA1261508.1 hypothetical protein LF1_40580 [Rubripirellula obstinata]
MSQQRVIFNCLDRQADIEKTVTNLPHWFQAGAAMFITFRMADSMPKEAVLRWQAEMQAWLRSHRLPIKLAEKMEGSSVHAKLLRSLPIAQQNAFMKMRDRAWHFQLDQCHGKCLLRQRKFAEIVAKAILYYDGEKYDIDRLVVMPNHVHAITQFYDGHDLGVISQSWLRYTARQINFECNLKGELWQGRPFDHIIRSPEQFEYLQQYIMDNPRKASLPDGEFLYWQRV